MKKYEFTGKTKMHDDVVLHQIRALVDIPDQAVKAGDVGGWIEHEGNLSHTGSCWVGNNARVLRDATVSLNSDVVSIDNVGSKNGTLTMYKTEDGVGVCRGCFAGTYDEFIDAVKETHGNNTHARFYLAIAPLLKSKILEEI